MLTLVATTVGWAGTAQAQTENTPRVSSTGPFTVAEGSVKVAQLTAEGFSEDAEDLFWTILSGYRLETTYEARLRLWNSERSVSVTAVNLVSGPTSLTAEADSCVNLAWDAPAENADAVTGYRVLRARGTAEFSTLEADTGTSDTKYTDSGGNAGETYSYRVVALRSGAPSEESNLVVVTVPPAPTPTDVTVDAVPIVVASTTADYFVLYVTHDVDGAVQELPVLVKLGEAGTTTLAENAPARPVERYRVEKYQVADPADVDGDCVDDLTELEALGAMNPVNPAITIAPEAGVLAITDHETFETLAKRSQAITTEHIKFFMFGLRTDLPHLFFQNTVNYPRHEVFTQQVLGIGSFIGGGLRGQIAYSPAIAGPDGSPGTYYFWTDPYQYNCSDIDRAYTMLVASMPVLEDNLVYWIPTIDIRNHQPCLPLYGGSRITLVFNWDVFGDTSYLALNPATGASSIGGCSRGQRSGSRRCAVVEASGHGVDAVLDGPQFGLADVEIGAFGQPAADDGVVLLVGGPLPGAVRLAEEHPQPGLGLDAGPSGHLAALVHVRVLAMCAGTRANADATAAATWSAL